MRVRASAGAGSFRRRPTLEKGLAEARAFLAALPADDGGEGAARAEPPDRRRRAARERAGRERVARLEAALAELPAAEAAKPADKRKQARTSSTDAEARVMKMPDGGFRPAYNLGFAADTTHRAIVGVDATTSGSDMAQAPPMLEQVEQRTGALPADWLMDGGFTGHPAIQHLAARGVRVLAPVPASRRADRDPHEPRPGEDRKSTRLNSSH